MPQTRKRNDLSGEKRRDLCASLSAILPEGCDVAAFLNKLEDEALVEIAAPEEELGPAQHTVVTVRGSAVSAVTRKPGLVLIHFGKAPLKTALSLYGFGAAAAAFSEDAAFGNGVKLFSALLTVAGLFRQELREPAALTLASLWETWRETDQSSDACYRRANQKARYITGKELPRASFEAALDELVRLGCVELVNDTVLLHETVRIEYH
ncbi:MAG: hypothetical protein ACSW8F_06745 [bacterium]